MPNQSDAPDPLDGLASTLDRSSFAAIAQLTTGLSPATLTQSYSDWWTHLLASPGKQLQLAAKSGRKLMRLADYAMHSGSSGDPEPAIEPLPQDRRFADPAWKRQPFDMIAQAFLLQQQWWHAATTGVSGVTKHHEAIVEFATRQMLDMVSPTNFIFTNPVLQQRIVETGGQCLVEGARHFFEDLQRIVRGEPAVGTEAYPVGEKVAC